VDWPGFEPGASCCFEPLTLSRFFFWG